MTEEPIKLSIIVSFYNEGKRIEKSLKRIAEYTDSKNFRTQVLLSDDRSTDDSIEIAKTYAKKIKHFEYLEPTPNQGKGKGAGIQRGIFAADGEYIMFMDADNSTDIFEADKLLPYLEEANYDIAMGSRYIKTPKAHRSNYFGAVIHGIKSVFEVLIFGHALDYEAKGKQGRFRQLISRGGNLVFTIFLNQSYDDQRCGFKMYKNRVAKLLAGLQTIPKFGFDTEYLAIAQKYKFKIIEVPVEWYDDNTDAKYKLNDAVREFKDMFVVFYNKVIGKYSKKNVLRRTGRTYEEHIISK